MGESVCRLSLAALSPSGRTCDVDETRSVVRDPVWSVRFGARGDGGAGLMTAKLTQEFVDAWLAAHRPDFEVAADWVYVNNRTPIPGRCLVEGCGAECAPSFNRMKDRGDGHCNACGVRATSEKSAARLRAHAESEIRRVAAERGYEVLGFFARRNKHSGNGSGFETKTYATLRCGCGNVWDAAQSSLCSHGKGCPSCAQSGFDTGKPANLYLLTRNKRGLQETQYGISNVLDQRLATHAANGWRLVDVISGPGVEIQELENLIKDAMKSEGIYRREYKDDKYTGYTEAWDARDGLRPFMSLEFLLDWAARAGSRERSAA